MTGNCVTKKKNQLLNEEIIDCINKLKKNKLFQNQILSPEAELELLTEAKSSIESVSTKATQELYKHFIKYAFKIAKYKFNSVEGKISFEDLLSEASIGILKAIKNFNLGYWGTSSGNNFNKIRFSGYAKLWINNCLNEFCKNNSSIIKFITSKEDERIFYQIGKVLDVLKIRKSCKELNNYEINIVAQKLQVKPKNIKKYVAAMNIENTDDEIDLNLEAIKNYNYNQEIIDNDINKEKILSEKDRLLYKTYCLGNNLKETSEIYNSNIETVRQKLHLIAKELYPEKKLKKSISIHT